MGFVADVISSIFGGGGGGTQIVEVPKVTTTARDLVTETSSQQAESPSMGTERKSKKPRGISSLMVNRDKDFGSGSGTGINL